MENTEFTVKYNMILAVICHTKRSGLEASPTWISIELFWWLGRLYRVHINIQESLKQAAEAVYISYVPLLLRAICQPLSCVCGSLCRICWTGETAETEVPAPNIRKLASGWLDEGQMLP